MKYIATLLVFIGLITFIYFGNNDSATHNVTMKSKSSKVNAGTAIDEYKGVKVYFNGSISKTHGRNLTSDGYNLGLKWQCVEFVKRFYFKTYHHKMPDSYGHAKDFYDKSLTNQWNEKRGMQQYQNGNKRKPKQDMIVVFDKNAKNPFGHIAIISKTTDHEITLVQQNWGTQSRMTLPLIQKNGLYFIDHTDVLGWLSL